MNKLSYGKIINLCFLLVVSLTFIYVRSLNYAVYHEHIYKIDLFHNQKIVHVGKDDTVDTVTFRQGSIDYKGEESSFEIISQSKNGYDVEFVLSNGERFYINNFGTSQVELFNSIQSYSYNMGGSKERKEEEIYKDIIVSSTVVYLKILSLQKKIKWFIVIWSLLLIIANILYFRSKYLKKM